MTTQSIAETLHSLTERLEKAKDKTIGLERRLETEKGKISKLEAKIKKYTVYQNFYKREG